MKIQYLGTAAYEGIPALFCNCEVCQKSRKAGGRAIRSRAQALVDGTLLLDFNGDTVYHCQKYGIDLQNVRNCLITHAHSDHLYCEDLSMLGEGYSAPKEGYDFTVYGTKIVIQTILDRLEEGTLDGNKLILKEVHPFEPFTVGKYEVTAFPAVHDPKSDPVFYQISDGEKTLLYAHDTGFFKEEVWDYFEKIRPHFDLVSLDCTYGNYPRTVRGGHMGLGDDTELKNRMQREGYADEKTVFVANHFSHNGRNAFYDDLVCHALKEEIQISYDGMEIEF